MDDLPWVVLEVLHQAHVSFAQIVDQFGNRNVLFVLEDGLHQLVRANNFLRHRPSVAQQGKQGNADVLLLRKGDHILNVIDQPLPVEMVQLESLGRNQLEKNPEHKRILVAQKPVGDFIVE